MAITYDQAKAAADSARSRYSAFAPVIGVGILRIGEDFGLKVLLEHAPEPGVELPAHINDVPVQVVVSGRVVAYGA